MLPRDCRFDAVIHFAGRKAVGESVEFPMLYYTHNVAGTVNLIEAMRKHKVKQVSQASLAAVLGLQQVYMSVLHLACDLC